RKLLAVALAPLLALAGSIAFAQDMDLGPGGSLTIGDVVVDGGGVAIGGAVVLDDSGLSITGGPSVTLAGINAGNQVITNVLDGVAATDAVNVGQLNAVGDVASAAQSAAAQNATGIADNAAAIATNAADILANANQIDAVRATAEAGWNISAEGGAAANVAPDATVDFSGDGNIEVARTGTDLQFNLADAIEVDSVLVGGMTLDVDGIDAAGKKITNLANGDISATSSDAVTGQQVHELFFEGGTAFGVRYFRANSIADDAEAIG